MANKTFEATLKLLGRIDGSFKAAISSASRSIENLDKLSKKFGHSTNSGFTQMAKGADHAFGRIERSAVRTHGKISKLFGGISTGLGFGIGAGLFEGAVGTGEGVVEAVKAAANAAGQQQLDMTSLTTLLKSPQKAKEMYDAAFKYSSESHFRMDDVVNMQRQMIARGMTQQQVATVTPQIGDVATGLGIKNPNDLSLGFLEAYSGGNANLRELNMMTQHGVPILKTLETMLGKDAESVKKMITKRQVSWDMIEKGLVKLTGPGGIFFGATKAGSTTYQGRLSTTQDYAQGVQRAVGRPIMGEVTKVLGKFIDSGSLGKLYDWTEKFSSGPMENAFNAMNAAFAKATDAGKFKEMLSTVEDIAQKMGGAIGKMFGGANFSDNFSNGIDKLNASLRFIDEHGAQITGTIKGIGAALIVLKGFEVGAGVMEFFGMLAEGGPIGIGIGAIAAAGGLIAANWGKIGPAVQPAITAIQELSGKVLQEAMSKWGQFMEKTGPTWAHIGEDINKMGKPLLDIFQKMGPLIDKVTEGLKWMSALSLNGLVAAAQAAEKGFDGLLNVVTTIDNTLNAISNWKSPEHLGLDRPVNLPPGFKEAHPGADLSKPTPGPLTVPATKPTSSARSWNRNSSSANNWDTADADDGRKSMVSNNSNETKNIVVNQHFHGLTSPSDFSRQMDEAVRSSLRSSYA